MQGRVGVLEHHLHAAVEAEVPGFGQRRAVQPHAPARHRGEPAQRLQHGRLPGTALADDAEALARADGERDPGERLHRAGAAAEADLEVLDVDQRRVRSNPFAASGGRAHRDVLGPERVEPRVLAREGRQRPGLGVDARQALEQPARVRVPRPVQLVGGQLLEHLAGVHDQHPVAERADQAQVVADEDQPHAAIRHEVVEDPEHVHLHRHVERRGGLVGDQQIGFGGQHHRDHRALAHPARQLVRVGAHDARGVGDAHGLERGERPALRLRAPAAVQPHRLDDLAPDRHDGVQRELRVLHDHRQAGAAQPPPRARRRVSKIDPVELEAVGGGGAGRRGQPEQRPPGLGFPRPALADDAEPLAPELEADAAHDLHGSSARREGHAQVLDGEERPRRSGVAGAGARAQRCAFGSSTSRNPSPRKLKPSETTKIAMPGIVATHQ